MELCPNCKKKTLVVSIFGSVCGNCFHEDKGDIEKIKKIKFKDKNLKIRIVK